MLKYYNARLVEYGKTKKRRQTKVTAICHCGKEFDTFLFSIKTGKTSSCGCSNHGYSNTPTYRSWVAMKKRCTNKKYQMYRYYGERGVSYDKRWDDFTTFLIDMGERPNGKTLDRIDVDGNYCKENCRWVSTTRQARNRTNTKFVTFKGENIALADLCEKYKKKYGTVWMRLKRGWSVEKALS